MTMSRPLSRALLSVSDKSGLVELARELHLLGVELVSTGGTKRALAEAGLPIRDVSDVTGFPEVLDGRVKTLHPRIHAGILAIRANPRHQATMAELDLPLFDLVVVNLYPFEETIARPEATPEEIIENIDIGGPALIRAAAKNFHDVAVVTDPSQYPDIIAELRTARSLSLETRQRLAARAFARTASYDAAIANFMQRTNGEQFPQTFLLSLDRRQVLRYGENPHQAAAWYAERRPKHPGIAQATVLGGKELSYNNVLDLDSAWALVAEFSEPACVVIKHNNPCGAAIAPQLPDAFERAYEGDPMSAFGGILGFNREVDEATAERITDSSRQRFIECMVAPSFSETAVRLLTERPKWGKNLRLVAAGSPGHHPDEIDLRRISGGMLVQSRDLPRDDWGQARCVTRRSPTAVEDADLRFAWRVCKHVKSNAIVVARDGQVVGVGAGQMSRVDAVRIAVQKAGERARGAVLASDAFFPFADNVEEAAAAGVTAIVQPGGSVRDADSINACDRHGLAMIFTSVRHFRH
ncbi:MAG: bifunctional phosphoribosylaminoimidazolecarboxamide formyltransferase/IMP cyclohydrolase [Gemmataceae bacterium]|nr:bifunctional phosphoribosylaminoimidazolecarboxamide formyltransferase/IMP cyclohydrolase [Gemmataceae bacterium]